MSEQARLPEVERAPKPARVVAPAVLAGLTIAVLGTAGFLWMAAQVQAGTLEGFDQAVRTWVVRNATAPLTDAMRGITHLGSFRFLRILFLLAVLGFTLVRWHRALAWLAIAMAGDLVIEHTLKNFYARPRPEPFFADTPVSFSFPSGHALAGLVFYGTLAALVSARVKKRWIRVAVWAGAVVMALLIGWSRVYLGVHYLTDVIASYCAGAVWLTALVITDRWVERRRSRSVET